MVLHYLSCLKDGIEQVIACVLNNHLILLHEAITKDLGKCSLWNQFEKQTNEKDVSGKIS